MPTKTQSCHSLCVWLMVMESNNQTRQRTFRHSFFEFPAKKWQALWTKQDPRYHNTFLLSNDSLSNRQPSPIDQPPKGRRVSIWYIHRENKILTETEFTFYLLDRSLKRRNWSVEISCQKEYPPSPYPELTDCLQLSLGDGRRRNRYQRTFHKYNGYRKVCNIYIFNDIVHWSRA